MGSSKEYLDFILEQLSEMDDVSYCVKEYLHWLVQHKTENFANGREMRNLFELALSNQANRLAEKTDISDEELNEIAKEDLPEWVIHPQNNEG